ncbi:MAG: hypothetical protein JW838_15585 [Spirochaetes bacterium]|nr:hypothetical protein [Spirochaetota bacterium]
MKKKGRGGGCPVIISNGKIIILTKAAIMGHYSDLGGVRGVPLPNITKKIELFFVHRVNTEYNNFRGGSLR